jgi:ABC-type transport system substrate-binding protein
VKLLRTFFEFVLACLVLSSAINTIMAQTKSPTPQQPSTAATPVPSPTPLSPAANPADVASVDSIIAAVYEVISVPAGKKRDWDRMKS